MVSVAVGSEFHSVDVGEIAIVSICVLLSIFYEKTIGAPATRVEPCIHVSFANSLYIG